MEDHIPQRPDRVLSTFCLQSGIMGCGLLLHKNKNHFNLLQIYMNRSIRLKQLLFIKYVFRQDILMNKRPNQIIFLLKAGALCWEADGNGAKL